MRLTTVRAVKPFVPARDCELRVDGVGDLVRAVCKAVRLRRDARRRGRLAPHLRTHVRRQPHRRSPQGPAFKKPYPRHERACLRTRTGAKRQYADEHHALRDGWTEQTDASASVRPRLRPGSGVVYGRWGALARTRQSGHYACACLLRTDRASAKIATEFLVWCADDFTDAYKLLDLIRRDRGAVPPEGERELALGVVRELLEADFVRVGEWSSDAPGLRYWSGPTRKLVERVGTMWTADHAPEFGHPPWFYATPAGKSAVERRAT